MSVDASEAARLLEREWGATVARLPHLSPDRPTRLEGWTVSDLAAHLVWGAGLEADGLRRARLGISEPAQGGEPSPHYREQAGRLRAVVEQLLAELGQAGDDGAAVPMPYGPIDPGVARAIFVMEAAVHGSDVAHAAGEDDRLEADVIAPTAMIAAAFLPITAAGAEAPPPGTSYVLEGDTVRLGFRHDGGGWLAEAPEHPAVSIAGPDSDILLFALGRRGLDGLTVRGDGDAAAAFKEHLPGL